MAIKGCRHSERVLLLCKQYIIVVLHSIYNNVKDIIS